MREERQLRLRIGDRIRRFREAIGLGQKELAAELLVSKSAVSQYELGVVKMDVDRLEALAQFFDIKVEAFTAELDNAEIRKIEASLAYRKLRATFGDVEWSDGNYNSYKIPSSVNPVLISV